MTGRKRKGKEREKDLNKMIGMIGGPKRSGS